jgi:hypothetical protein
VNITDDAIAELVGRGGGGLQRLVGRRDAEGVERDVLCRRREGLLNPSDSMMEKEERRRVDFHADGSFSATKQ